MIASQVSNVFGDELAIERRFCGCVENIGDKILDQRLLYLIIVHIGQVYIMNLFDDQLSLALSEESTTLRLVALLTQILTKSHHYSLVEAEHLGNADRFVIE